MSERGDNGKVLAKGHKVSVMQDEYSPKDLLHSTMPRVNNTILHT